VIEAVVDRLEAPMPAKVTFDQASKFAESLLRGEPDRSKIISTQVSDKVRELV
jgi:pyruvate dehydrogenase (quinone)